MCTKQPIPCVGILQLGHILVDIGSREAMAAFRKSLQINPEQVKVQKLLQTYKVGP